jgi:hypothetical protein
MEDLQKLSASGGNDIYGAGTFKLFTLDVATVTLTSVTSAGTATITANGLAKVATYATSKAVTAATFAGANADAYAAIGLTVTNSGDTVIFTSAKPNLKVEASIVNLTTDLTGTVAYTKNEGSETATFTLAATGTNSGLVTVNGVSKVFIWDTNVGTTSAAFVAANSAAYAAVGVALTGTVTLIFTTIPGTTITDTSVKTLVGDATATIVRTGTKLPHPVYAVNVVADAVITSYKYLSKGSGSGVYAIPGYIKDGYKKALGTTLAVGAPVLIFEYPVVEIVIASGSLVFNFVK